MEIRFTFHFVPFSKIYANGWQILVGKDSLPDIFYSSTFTCAYRMRLVEVNNNSGGDSDDDDDGSSSSGSRATHGMPNISHCIYFGQIHQMNHLHCSVTVEACSSNMDTHSCKMLERRNTKDDVTQTVWVLLLLLPLLDSIYSFWVSFTFSFYHLRVSKTQATHFFWVPYRIFCFFFSFRFVFGVVCGLLQCHPLFFDIIHKIRYLRLVAFNLQ